MTSPILCGTIVLAPLAALLPGQVYVVDTNGGAGSHFTDLPTAVAAVPNGATLRVRAGTYAFPSINAKALQLVGENRTSVVLQATQAGNHGVFQTTATQPVLFEDMTFSIAGPDEWAVAQVRSAAGAVVFSRVDVQPPGLRPVLGFVIENCAQVQFHHCQLPKRSGSYPQARIAAIHSTLTIAHSLVAGDFRQTPALSLDASRCEATASTFLGGSGSVWCMSVSGSCFTAPGCDAVVASRGSVFLGLGTTCIGGDGAPPFISSFPPAFLCATRGGNGLTLNGSTARLFASQEAGGTGGAGSSPCPPGAAGLPIAADAASLVVRAPAATPASADLAGVSMRNTTVQWVLQAAPNSLAALVLSDDPRLVPIDPLAPGSLLVNIALTLPLSVPASGVLSLPVLVHGAWPLGQTYYGQFASIEPQGSQLWITNSVPWHTSR